MRFNSIGILDDSLYGSGFGSSLAGVKFLAISGILAVVLALIATVLAFTLVLSKSGRCSRNKFVRFLVRVCDFRGLIIESILKALYIFTSALVLFSGFLSLFNFGSGSYILTFISGILTMLLGPIFVRIVYELIMLAVLAVKNIIQINNKLSKLTGDEAPDEVRFDSDFSALREHVSNQESPHEPSEGDK